VSHNIEDSVLQRARRGDKTAFDTIQATYTTMAERFVWRLVGQAASLDDVVQNAFLALYLNIERIENISHLRGFLFRVLRNQCYDALRKQGRYQKVAIDEVNPLTLSQHNLRSAPEDNTHWLLLYDRVQKAIDQLPENQRQTLVMYFQFELSYAEIAEATNVSIGTVKSRIFNARKQLTRLLPPEIVHEITSIEE